MKVLIVNKFFYPRGGDCVVAINTRDLLIRHGHQVRVFAMDYPDNIDISDKSQYVSQVDFAGGLRSKLNAIRRMMGKGDIRKAFCRVLDDFQPDVVHLHNIHSYLSPIVGEIAHARGIRVVWTLHDYKLFCPSYLCRQPDGTNCTECVRDTGAVVRYRCMKGSFPASFIAKQEALCWNRIRLERFTDRFIAPSKFMAAMMASAGYNSENIETLTNFIGAERLPSQIVPTEERSNYFCYVGRLSKEKGVETMLRAAALAKVKLKIAGDGPMAESLREEFGDIGSIEFLGHLDACGVKDLLGNALASVIPSECYENNPLGVIESLCAGTPVIGANIGGIPELIEDADIPSGLTFTSGNRHELEQIFRNFKPNNFNNDAIVSEARNRFSADTHYEHLLNIYSPTNI